MSGLEMKARGGRLVHVRPTGRIDEEDLPAWSPSIKTKQPGRFRRLISAVFANGGGRR